MDHEELRKRLRAKIAAMPPGEALSNLLTAMHQCDNCNKTIEMYWPYCAWCGYQLMEPKDALPTRE